MLHETQLPVFVFGASAAAVALLAIYDHLHGDEDWVGRLPRGRIRTVESLLVFVMLASLAVFLL